MITHSDEKVTTVMRNEAQGIVYIYTDGGCSPNPGKGGWGAVLRYNGEESDMCGGEADTTNNRMELTATIKSLNRLKWSCKVVVTTDSQYVKNGITKWITGWKNNDWRNSSGKPVKNVDLWKELDAACERHDIDWQWIKGHSGHIHNERADELATSQIMR